MNELERISQLEDELRSAEMELTRSVSSQASANAKVDEWNSEVGSLKKLIEVRKNRINPQMMEVGAVTTKTPVPLPEFDDGDADLSRVAWIENVVGESGSHGLKPPEILKLAAEAHVRMHENYPYTALAGLVRKGRVLKRGRRYFKNRQ